MTRDRNRSRGRRRWSGVTGVDSFVGLTRVGVKDSTLIERLTGLNMPRSVEIKVVLAAEDIMSTGNL